MTKKSLKYILVVWFISFTLLPLSSVAYIFHEKELIVEIIFFSLFFSSIFAYFLAKKILLFSQELKKDSFNFRTLEWDKQELFHRLGDSQQHTLSTIKLFLQETPKHLQLLDNAIEKNDFSRITTLAHTLKGTTANMSLLNITQIAKEIEKEAKYTKDIQNIVQLSLMLKQKCKNANELLTKFIKENQIQKHITLSKEDIQNSLSVLETMIKANEFIQTNEIELFEINVSSPLDLMIKKLQEEIDSFIFNKALVTIADIQIALKKGS